MLVVASIRRGASTVVPFVPLSMGDGDSRLPTCTVTFVSADSNRRMTFLNQIEEVIDDLISDEVVRCEQPQDRPFLDGVEGADPRVELLRRQIDFKMIETTFPSR